MKKTIRVVVLVVTMLLCLSFAGCKALDKQRMKQGFWQEDGTVLWNGEVYKLLNVDSYALNLVQDDDLAYMHITQSDVPVLLSEILGMYFEVCNNGLLLDGHTDGIYCRADNYEAVLERLEKGFSLGNICYEYFLYTDDFADDGYKTYTLTEEQKSVLLALYDTLEPIETDEEVYDEQDYWVFLYGCSEDNLLRQDLFTLFQSGDRYYIEDTENTYLIPEEKNSLFAEIMQCEVQANQD